MKCLFTAVSINPAWAWGEGVFFIQAAAKSSHFLVWSSRWIVELNSSQAIKVSVTPKCPLVATIFYSNHDHEFSVHVHLICDCDDHLERNICQEYCPSYIDPNNYELNDLSISKDNEHIN